MFGPQEPIPVNIALQDAQIPEKLILHDSLSRRIAFHQELTDLNRIPKAYIFSMNMMNFTSLLGVIPRGTCTIQKETATGVSVKKELRTKLSTSDQLKLSKQVREGGSDKFSFFKTTISISSDFKAIYDFHMMNEALSKAHVLFDMNYIFQILTESTVIEL